MLEYPLSFQQVIILYVVCYITTMRGEWKTEMLEHPDRLKQVEIENEQVLTSISVMIVGVVMEKNSRCYHGAY